MGDDLLRTIVKSGALGTISVFAVIFLLYRFAAERVEVIELHTYSEVNEIVTTRLWILDFEGFQYFRVGSDGSGWYDRLQNTLVKQGYFEMTRDGKSARYRSENRPEKSIEINQLMSAKYGWGDAFIGMLTGGRFGSIPIQLIPL